MKGETVLITRPAHLAGGLAEKLRSKGADVILFPTIEIQSIADQAGLESAFMETPTPDVGIFVSVNAVDAVSSWMNSKGLHWPASMKCAAVGLKTADSASAAFQIEHVIAPKSGFGANSLLELDEMRDFRNQSVAVFEGVGGSGLVQAGIGGKCRILSVYPVYRILQPKGELAPIRNLLAGSGVDYVAVTSVAGAKNLFAMLGTELSARLSDSTFVVYSSRIAQYLHSLGYMKVRVSRQASDDATVAAIANP